MSKIVVFCRIILQTRKDFNTIEDVMTTKHSNTKQNCNVNMSANDEQPNIKHSCSISSRLINSFHLLKMEKAYTEANVVSEIISVCSTRHLISVALTRPTEANFQS